MPHSQNRWASHAQPRYIEPYTVEGPDGNPIPLDNAPHHRDPDAYTYANTRPEYDEHSYRRRDEARRSGPCQDRRREDSYSPHNFRAPNSFHETAPSSDGTFHREPDTSTYSYTNPRPEYDERSSRHRHEARRSDRRRDRMREHSYRPPSFPLSETAPSSDPRSRNDIQARNPPSGFRYVDPDTIDLPRRQRNNPSNASSPTLPRRQNRPAYERWSTYPMDRRHGEYIARYAQDVYDFAQDALAAIHGHGWRRIDEVGSRTRRDGSGGGYRDRDRSDEAPGWEVWVRSGDGVWEEGVMLDGEWIVQRRG
ncbi:hypothetical protein G7Y79_00009g026050 [Physcia stellaris]|nr:hypothetical protein G7Y79_00009g026050 [Physcia stellaris]